MNGAVGPMGEYIKDSNPKNKVGKVLWDTLYLTKVVPDTNNLGLVRFPDPVQFWLELVGGVMFQAVRCGVPGSIPSAAGICCTKCLEDDFENYLSGFPFSFRHGGGIGQVLWGMLCDYILS